MLCGRHPQADPAKPAHVFAMQAPLRVDSLEFALADPAVYSLYELTIDLSAAYDNPFDPDQIDVFCTFTSPTGRVHRVNAFYFQDYSRSLNGQTEVLKPVGKPGFHVRFCPDEPGTWRYVVTAKDRTGTATAVFGFHAKSSNAPGYVALSPVSKNHFQFRPPVSKKSSQARSLFLIGENMCWSGASGTFEFDKWLHDLGSAGGNFIRLWCSNANTTLEQIPDKNVQETANSTYHGLGAYSLDHAWRIDRILDAAEANGVYTMLCLGTYGDLKTGGYFNEGQWPVNPYNAANGGPCSTPEEFWINPEARKLYQRKLRYFAARYGWRTHLHSWEFWNEADAPAAWVEEMADFMKGTGAFAGHPADPFGHLVSTTYGNDAVWKIPGIDFTMTHSYGTGNVPDISPVAADDAYQYRGFEKPHFLAEFGIDWRSGDEQYDKKGEGVNLHNGLWAGLANGCAGTSMLWYWDGYVAPKNLYSQFTAVRKFSDLVPWASYAWTALNAEPPVLQQANETFTDMFLPCNGDWGRAAYTDVTITPFGAADHRSVPGFLFGPSKPEMKQPVNINVDYREAGTFGIKINTVSDRSRLRVLLDGKQVLDHGFKAAPPPVGISPEYTSTRLFPEYGIYQAQYGLTLTFPIPAGPHKITLENTDGDWMSISGVELKGYRSSRYSSLQVYGVKSEGGVVIWVHNALNTWKSRAEGTLPAEIRGADTTLHNLKPGRYRLRWFNTTTGDVLEDKRVKVKQEDLQVNLPPISEDAAALLTPIK